MNGAQPVLHITLIRNHSAFASVQRIRDCRKTASNEDGAFDRDRHSRPCRAGYSGPVPTAVTAVTRPALAQSGCSPQRGTFLLDATVLAVTPPGMMDDWQVANGYLLRK